MFVRVHICVQLSQKTSQTKIPSPGTLAHVSVSVLNFVGVSKTPWVFCGPTRILDPQEFLDPSDFLDLRYFLDP